MPDGMFEMNEKGKSEQGQKELLKRLRAARKQSIEALGAKVKGQKELIERIREQLGDGPKSVPEMSSALGLPSSQIMWYVAALKKYGEVVEAEKVGSYFRYELPVNGALRDSDGRGK